jgi:molybdate transport system substrate-binding protein
VQAGTVLVAVAANFQAPMARVAQAFERATGHELRLSAGPTMRFYSQIALGGAPYEVLVAADQSTPSRLIAEGHAVAGTAFTYAIGQLVLWSPQSDLVDAHGAVLGQPQRWRRLAVANPKLAPYGQAAQQVLRARGLWEPLAPRLITGESISQAYQFVVSGNADLGFVALSQLQSPGEALRGSMWPVPASLHAELRQDAVLLTRGRDSEAARALLAFLKTSAARELMQAYGYRFDTRVP